MAKLAQNPRRRPVMSLEQRLKLSAAIKSYVANDPRWPEHRANLAAAQKKPEQRAKLSEKQKAYMERNPDWPEHHARIVAAGAAATRLTLLPEEVEKIIAERRKGRTMEYLSEELCVDPRVIRRGLKALGITVDRSKVGPRVQRGRGHWRSFDEP